MPGLYWTRHGDPTAVRSGRYEYVVFVGHTVSFLPGMRRHWHRVWTSGGSGGARGAGGAGGAGGR